MITQLPKIYLLQKNITRDYYSPAKFPYPIDSTTITLFSFIERLRCFLHFLWGTEK